MNLEEIEAELLQELDALALDETVLLDSEESCLDHYLKLDSHRPVSTLTLDESELLPSNSSEDHQNDNLHSSTYFSWIDAIPIDSGDLDLLTSLTEEIELEAEQERLLIQKRKTHAKRKRELHASIERVHFLHQSDSASRLQMVVRGFLSRRRTERKQRIRKGILKLFNIMDTIQRKRTYFIWNDYFLKQKSFNRIAKWIMNMKSYQIIRKVSICFAYEILYTVWRRRMIQTIMLHWNDEVNNLRDQDAIIEKRKHAVTCIQSITRRNIAIEFVKQKRLAKRDYAATIIQSHLRRLQARQVRDSILHQLHVQKANAAIQLQSFFRGRTTRRRFTEVIKQAQQADMELVHVFNFDNDDADILLYDFEDMMRAESNIETDWKPELPQVKTRQKSSNTSYEEMLGKISSRDKEVIEDKWNVSERVYEVGTFHILVYSSIGNFNTNAILC